MKKRMIFFIILFLLTLNIYSKSDDYDALKPLLEVYSLIRNNYVDEEKTDPDELIQNAIKGMINSIDPFSQYLDKQAYKDMGEDTRAEFGGLGIEISIKDGQLIVVAPFEGTPAYEAGIKAGDKIMQIDGESTKGIEIMDAVHKLRGTPGTKVTISIQRGQNPNWKDYTITRAIIKIETVRSALLEDNIGYIRIVEFMGDAAEKVKNALNEFKKLKVEKLIIDLRDNPGGLLDASIKIAEYFLPKGSMIVYTEGRDKNKRLEFKSENNPLFKGNIVVLINKGSASASEILAGALQDNKKAVIVGTTSFGKGSVQTIIPLSDNSALRLTTAQYMTPNGKKIHGVGIEPDIVLEEPVPSSWTSTLYEKNYFDDYATEYLKINPEGLKTHKEKKSEVKVSESNIKVLFKKDFDDELLDDFKRFLRNKNEEIMQQEFMADREIILRWIKTSIARKQKGRFEERKVAIENDTQIKRAINILNTLYKLQALK
ncbi:MAG: S41 family peptidase [Candidatus Goldbacteria bacterium]|nr:S41 family peptidase [Candidatus Goldiibacteriota bacterium]